MTDPPSSGMLTRYVLENPWPLGIGLVLLAIVLAWTAVRQGNKPTFAVAGVAVLLGVIVLAVGAAVTTAGEHGKRITKLLVVRVVANDLTGAVSLLDSDATLSIGSPTNPGLDLDYIRGMIDQASRYKIISNRIRMLDGFTVSSDTAIVHLGCLTETNFGFTPSTWIIRVEQQDAGDWRIAQITWMSISNQTPRAGGGWDQ